MDKQMLPKNVRVAVLARFMSEEQLQEFTRQYTKNRVNTGPTKNIFSTEITAEGAYFLTQYITDPRLNVKVLAKNNKIGYNRMKVLLARTAFILIHQNPAILEKLPKGGLTNGRAK